MARQSTVYKSIHERDGFIGAGPQKVRKLLFVEHFLSVLKWACGRHRTFWSLRACFLQWKMIWNLKWAYGDYTTQDQERLRQEKAEKQWNKKAWGPLFAENIGANFNGWKERNVLQILKRKTKHIVFGMSASRMSTGMCALCFYVFNVIRNII